MPLLRMLVLPAVGAALGFLLLVKVILPLAGVGSVERVVQLGRHLDKPLAPAPSIALLGNSITREGVDTRIMAETAPAGWNAQNFAISACGLNEIRILLPKLLQAHPAAVAFGLRPEDLGRLDDMELDKAYAYAMGGFVKAWPADWGRDAVPGIGEENYAALRSTPFQQELHFRTAPLNVINQQVRIRLRRGLRQIAPDNWTDPYELNFSVRDERLTRHIDTLLDNMRSRLADGADGGAKLTATMAAEIHQAGATPVLIVLPMHPAFADEMRDVVVRLRATLQEIAERNAGLVVDALDVLSAEEFADAVHPNAAGRETYSRFLGRALAPLGEHEQHPVSTTP